MRTIDLNGQWEVRAASPEGLPAEAGMAREWFPASVPGVIHTDLMKAGLIPDPFVGMNENQVQWVADVPWVYRRTFNVAASILGEDSVELVAEGLDTIARIRINDLEVGTSRNMFISSRFAIRDALRPGANVIEIAFDSPVAAAKAEEAARGRLKVSLESHRVHVRKAQYSFGWDWGPRLTTSGIWRPVRIEAYSHARIRDPFIRVTKIKGSTATLSVSATLEYRSKAPRTKAPRTLRIRVAGIDTRVPVRGRTVKTTVTLRRARLWWPNGNGTQTMYAARLMLYEGPGLVETVKVPFAVRTVRLLQERDREGRSFIIEVNGKRLFCKGADWIPGDSFLPRMTPAVYERLLTLARDASMNMIRVWGGGIYEDDAFYDTCDRLGLMVWQDFMYACGEYPDHPEFLQEAAREAEQVVRRLRNHPSVVLWCGNNECEWIFCTRNEGKGPDDMRGAPIFKSVLPRVVSLNDGTRPYWRSTPFGSGFPNDPSNGNRHQWEVWSAWKDFREYELDAGRFISEFGFQAPANRAALERVVGAADREARSPVMLHHNKQVDGTERLLKFMDLHFKPPENWEDFIHTGQVLQAEALKCAVEHWRRRKFFTAGALFWQLNDCWPVTSWSVIDSDLQPKAGYFYAKRFFAPLLVSVTGGGNGIEVWGTNDTFSDVRARLHLELCSVSGGILWRREFAVRLRANASAVLRRVPVSALKGSDPRSTYLRAELRVGRRAVSVNRHFFCEYRDLNAPAPLVRVEARKGKKSGLVVELSSPILALAVGLSSRSGRLEFSDNFMTLDAGRPARVTVRGSTSPSALKRDILVRALR